MDIAAWLRSLGLEQHVEAFRQNAIEADVLPELGDEHLKELGLPLGHRLKILKAIATLRDAVPFPPTAPNLMPQTERSASSPAERRQLTVMFVDVVASTALASRLDPEEFGEILRAYQNVAAGEIARFGGHVARFMGDGVLAFFGWPKAHEDEAERAVRAGLAIADAVAQIKAPDTPLAVRVGIATGLVVVGDLIGAGAAREEDVVGETPNLAARLQSLAEPGTVIVADTTRRLLGGLFELADLGEHALHGFAAPVLAWRVLGEGRAESRFEALRATGLLPLIGREQERALLLDRWRQAKEGEGQVVLLSGEPGIGKSRIVLALRERLRQEPRTNLRYQSSPYHVNSALWPIIEQLERAAGLTREDPPATRLSKLEQLLAQAVDDVAAVAPLFAELLAIPAEGRYPPLDIAPAQRKARTFQALLAQLAGLARRRPVLMVLEDAHWLDPTTLELFELVVERIQRLPVLLVVTFRPEFKAPWTGQAHVTLLTLNRLGGRQAAAIVEQVTGGKMLPPEVLAQILAKTDGVPLFVEELTKAVLEAGLLRDAGERFELAGPLAPFAIPSTLQDSLMARLDRMAPVKEVAQVGAVIGREFPHALLAAVAPMPEDQLATALAELVASDLVFRRGIPPEAHYAFKHALVQDAAYESLLKSRRQQLHGRVAEVLEARFPDTRETQPELLAHHFTGAGLAEKALDYWLRAGQRATERSAYRETIAHLQKGLELIRALPDGQNKSRREYRFHNALGAAFMATKGFGASEVEQAYLRARDAGARLGDVGELFPATWGLWLVYEQRCEFETAKRLLRELFVLAEKVADDALRLQAHHAGWTTFCNLPELANCWTHAQAGIALYHRDRHRDLKFLYGGHDPGVCCRVHGAVALWHLGYPQRAADLAHDGVRLAEELAHPVSLALALVFSSFVHQHRREPAVVRALAERAIALCTAQGLVAHFLAAGHVMRGWALAVEGLPKDGIEEISRGLTDLRATRAYLRRPYYMSLLAEAYWRAGDTGRAQATLAEALKLIEDTGERRWEAGIHRLNGELLLAEPTSKRTEAEPCLIRSLEVARRQSAKALELRAAMSLARLGRDQSKRVEAHDLLSPIYEWFTEGFETADLTEAKELLSALG